MLRRFHRYPNADARCFRQQKDFIILSTTKRLAHGVGCFSHSCDGLNILMDAKQPKGPPGQSFVEKHLIDRWQLGPRLSAVHFFQPASFRNCQHLFLQAVEGGIGLTLM